MRTGKGPFLKGTKIKLVASGSKANVFDDGEEDIMNGDDGRDWLFASLSDVLEGRQGDEDWDLL